MKRRMMSLLLAMAMLCTLVPTAFAKTDRWDIEIKADVDDEDEYYFDEVYDAIVEGLIEFDYNVSRYDYYVEFDYDEDEFDTELYDDKCDDYYYEVDLDNVEDLYLYIDLRDDQWEGSYTVYDEEDDKVLTGDIIIYFDGYSGDTDVELTWSYDEDYYFDDDNTDEGDSVYDVIDEILKEELTSSQRRKIDGYYFEAVGSKSDDVAELELDDEWYLDIYDTGTWSGEWIAYEDFDENGEYNSKKDEEILSGKLYIEVTSESAAGGDITYTALADEDVTMDVDDFEAFWEDEFSKGTLKYVKFDKVSSSHGELVDEDGESLSKSDECYVSPGRRDIDLDGVTFEPKRNYTGTVSLGFTAYGTNNKDKDDELTGTVTIVYTAGDSEPIVYDITGDSVTLDGDDFLDNYEDTMDDSVRTLEIKFREVPTNGTLYYNYNEKTGKGTELTSKNIGSYTFSTSASASRSIDDVTYVPDSKGKGDSVEFACYAGGGLCYYGEVSFEAAVTVKDVTITMSGTSAGIPFNAADFLSASQDMLSVTYMIFGTPSNGALYKDWNGVTGTRVTASDKFSYTGTGAYSSLSTLTYVPTSGYSGTASIAFSAFTTRGTIVNGKITISVTAAPTVTFTDVASTSWSYPYITRLATLGVVGGVTATTYGPKQQVKWGEALKMVLRSAGYPAQTELSGNNWAANYLTYAYNNGIVTSNKIDLTKSITRLEMAELVVRALKMQPATSVNAGITPPTDTVNGYVYALYNLGIVSGDSSSGKNLYLPGSTLLRDEMAKIVCGVMDHAN